MNKEQCVQLNAAALLHDIGHGPFSHLFEEVLAEKGITHENITTRIIRETEISDILKKYGINTNKFSELCVGLSNNHPRFMNDIIAGFLSVDTMDYLLRDSYFSGVEYGKVDVHRIINAYEISKESIAINRDSLYALEALMLARYEMFRAVYFHKSVRACAIMLTKAMTLSDETLHFSNLKDLKNYLNLTDESTINKIINSKSNNENIKFAKELVNDYLKRKMLKLVFEKEVLRTDQFIGKIFSQSKFRSNVSEEISKKSKVPEKYIFIDVSTATSVPTTSSKKTLSEITIISKTAKKKTVQKIRAGELPLMNSILGYMDIIRIYTTGKYKEKVSQAVNTIFEKESR
tara:strand:- start:2208 stop:3248 length:1041 start_codon:yes stop_codon:yes gene_type:complete